MKINFIAAVAFVSVSLAGPLAHADVSSRLPEFSVLATGASHTLFARPDGQLYAWGDDSYGELGDESNASEYTPIYSELSAVVHVAAGNQFSMAITSDGTLYTWGRNDLGQLGNGTFSTSTTAADYPSRVGTGHDWRYVAAGWYHALGIRYDGTLWAWGDNRKGQLGLNNLSAQSSPQKVGSANDWIAVTAGLSFSIALKADGTLWGAGANDSGQMGNTGAGSLIFSQISQAHWRSISAGTGHVLAVKDDGSLWAWGIDDKSQVGDNQTAPRTSPFQLSTGQWRTVAAGDRHSLAINASGALYAWGDNFFGQLGKGDTVAATTPTLISSSGLHQYIAAGGSASMALRADGVLQMWGRQSGGQVGNGPGVPKQTTPVQPTPSGLSDWATDAKPAVVAAGRAHMLTIRSTGKLESWGANNAGQLGNAHNSPVYLPTEVPVGTFRWLALAAGEDHSLAIKSDGTLWAWGANYNGQLGNGLVAAKNQPQEIRPDLRWIKVAAHYAQSYAITAGGDLYAWGDNSEGQGGTNDPSGAAILNPTRIGTTKKWVAVASSEQNTYAISSDGLLYAWGSGPATGLANSPTYVRVPTQATTLSSWVTIGAGKLFAEGIRASGFIYGWGDNSNEHLGNPSLGAHVNVPTHLGGATTFYLLAMTQYSTLASTARGEVQAWGENTFGELALGTVGSTGPSTPDLFDTLTMAGGYNSFIQIGGYAGERKTVGDNSSGQLGIGSADPNPEPSPFSISEVY